MRQPDPEDGAGVGPEYSGSADRPVDAPGGDVVALLRHEADKVTGVLEEVALLLDPEPDAARHRLGSAARELVEHLAASERVLWSSLSSAAAEEDRALQAQRERESALAVRLSEADSLAPDLDAGTARTLIDQVLDVLRTREETLIPWLADLSDDQRQRLAEDLRQVAG